MVSLDRVRMERRRCSLVGRNPDPHTDPNPYTDANPHTDANPYSNPNPNPDRVAQRHYRARRLNGRDHRRRRQPLDDIV